MENPSCLPSGHIHGLVLKQDNDRFRLLNTLAEKITLLEQAGLDHLIVLPFTTAFSRLSSCDFIRQDTG